VKELYFGSIQVKLDILLLLHFKPSTCIATASVSTPLPQIPNSRKTNKNQSWEVMRPLDTYYLVSYIVTVSVSFSDMLYEVKKANMVNIENRNM
jgi:hypothetical protein